MNILRKTALVTQTVSTFFFPIGTFIIRVLYRRGRRTTITLDGNTHGRVWPLQNMSRSFIGGRKNYRTRARKGGLWTSVACIGNHCYGFESPETSNRFETHAVHISRRRRSKIDFRPARKTRVISGNVCRRRTFPETRDVTTRSARNRKWKTLVPEDCPRPMIHKPVR